MTPEAGPPTKLVQWPFIGVVVLLVVLILLTPNLINAGGPSAGSLETQAVLVVDHLMGSNVTHFYVHGLGTARYLSIAVAVAPARWPAPVHSGSLNWTNASYDTHTLGVTVRAFGDPIAVNVTADYVDPSGVTVFYVGVYVVHTIGTTLYAARIPADPSGLASSPLGGPPLSILLGTRPTGGTG